MAEFLKLNSPDTFWDMLEENLNIHRRKETASYREALGRVLADDLGAPADLPPFSRSTVDGFAVRSGDLAGTSESLPAYLDVIGTVKMGMKTDLTIGSGQAAEIPTGGMLPAGADAALMIEHTGRLDKTTIEATRPVSHGENVIWQGDDIEKGEILLAEGARIRPQDVGALAGLGMTEIPVYSRPEVAVISTGNELVPPEKDADDGEIRDINTYSLSALITDCGGLVREIGIVEDTEKALKKEIRASLTCDLVLVSGGSSVGVKDITLRVLNSLGEPGVLLHGVSVKPGKPTILAVIDSLPVIGLPGHPASAWTVSSRFITPLVRVLAGELELEQIKAGRTGQTTVKALLSRNLFSDSGREEYVPVSVTEKEGHLRAVPILGKSSQITTLVRADGFVRIDTYDEGKDQGEEVEVILF